MHEHKFWKKDMINIRHTTGVQKVSWALNDKNFVSLNGFGSVNTVKNCMSVNIMKITGPKSVKKIARLKT